MGRWPPLFLQLARRVAPQKCGVMEDGAQPAASRLMKIVGVDSSLLAWSGDGHPAAPFKWLGHRPEGPGAEPLGHRSGWMEQKKSGE